MTPLTIDNLEGRCQKDTEQDLINALFRYCDKTMAEMNKNGNPCNSVNLGIRYIKSNVADALEKCLQDGLIKVCKTPKIDYIRRYKLYTDASEQYIISNKELSRLRQPQGQAFGE